MVTQGAGTPSHTPVMLSGIIPPLSDSYHPRPETGPDLALRPGETVVLTAQGGTGKTELAAEFAHARLGARDVEVLVWVGATGRDAILSGFAQAANAVGAADLSLGAQAAAARFAAWLTRTRRSWALIIDDLRDAADLDGLWPAGPAGQVVMTTRLPALAVQGAFGITSGLRIVPVGGFSRREAMSYLTGRLIDHPDQRIEALDLGEDLGALPLSMAQAAAVMTVDELGCREYRAKLGERREHMLGVADVPDTVLAAWSLAAERADELAARRAGLADPRDGGGARRARDPRRGADLPGRVRLYHRPGEHGQPGRGPRRPRQPGAGRPGQHRSHEPGPHGADAPERPGGRARLPDAGRPRAGHPRRRGRADPGLAGARRGGGGTAPGRGVPGGAAAGRAARGGRAAGHAARVRRRPRRRGRYRHGAVAA